MSNRPGPQKPTVDQYGSDTHPAFGYIQASRISHGGSTDAGSVLFDSDVKHQHTVQVTLGRMTRRRDLQRDWLHPQTKLVQVEMSEAQWASFVSSMNTTGVPCTLRRTENEVWVPELEHDPRLAHSLAETRAAADQAFGRIQEAMASVDALGKGATTKERREAMEELRRSIANSTGNVEFASKSLAEHTENVVQRARADVEAMVTQRAAQLGLAPGEQAVTLEITA